MDKIYSCLYCGSEKYDIVYEFNKLPKFKQIGSKKDIVKCKNCSLQYCYPRNSNESMLDVYENNYWQEFQTEVGELQIKDRISDFEYISKERISYIKKFKSGGKFLDVGCSCGFLVNEANKEGFDAYGIDLNIKDIEMGKETYGVNLAKSFLGDYESYDFDVITTFNVIEHVSNPIKLLLEMNERLNDGGILVIGTHDVDCKNHLMEKENWKHIIPNEHLYFFNQNTLNKICFKTGFEVIYNNKPIENSIVGYYRKRGLDF
jgi:2-polyprenyl-3-methyl-5-hydroxy-6-metoxy-1,4-benzoquinol methylase